MKTYRKKKAYTCIFEIYVLIEAKHSSRLGVPVGCFHHNSAAQIFSWTYWERFLLQWLIPSLSLSWINDYNLSQQSHLLRCASYHDNCEKLLSEFWELFWETASERDQLLSVWSLHSSGTFELLHFEPSII